jgi:PKD repeat protein
MKYRLLIPLLFLTLLLIGTVNAVTWTNAGGCWTATDGAYSVVMWNATGSNTFIVPGATSIQYLINAGGGAGGGTAAGNAGGGGSGGVLQGNMTVSPGSSITINVGTGGSPVAASRGGKGGNSSLANGTLALDANGGGGGASYGNAVTGTGGDGGSGGGSGQWAGVVSTGGIGTSGQGTNGANQAGDGLGLGGNGGGGASETGYMSHDAAGGKGGDGILSSITGVATYYAGGASGGTHNSGSTNPGGGLGGGGTGHYSSNYPTAGTDGLGGGGGGGGEGYEGAAGGSGVVIIRYLTPGNNPIVSFTSNVTSGFAPPNVPVQFNDTSITSITDWNWSYTNTTPGNGTQIWWSQIRNATQSFGVGNWNINLNVTNASGSNVSTPYYWVNISQSTPPVASFTKDKTGGTVPLTVTFTDTSTNTPTSWLWVFGDGSTENNTVKNPVHTFTGAGTYNVNLTATNVYGSSTSGTQAITTGTVPVASFTANTSFGAPPLGVQFNDTSTDTVAMSAWNWSFTNITPGNNTQVWWSQIRNATGSFGIGNYLIKLNATNTYGSNISTQTTWVNVTTFNAGFTGTPTGGTPGTSVAFTESTTGFNTDSRTWDFGDGNTSTSLNPSHVYAYSGAFTVNLTAYNATAGYSSKVRTGYIVINPSGGVSGFFRQDIILSGLYTLTLTIKDSATHAPIPVCQIIDSNGDNTTTSTGVATFSYNYSVVVEYISSTGYNSMSVSYVMDRDRSETVYLTKTTAVANSTPVSQQNTLWSPPQVVFQVLDSNNNPIVGTPVSANAEFTTLPGGLAGAVALFSSTFGLSNTTAETILNQTTTYSGTTDSSGSVVFMLIPVISYNVTATDTSGVNYTISIMPKDSYYQIKTQNATNPSQANLEIAAEKASGASIYNTTFYEPSNGTIGVMGANIYDSTGKTNGADCWYTLVDNGTTWWNNESWAYGSGLQIINKTVPIVPYQQWKWGCNTL